MPRIHANARTTPRIRHEIQQAPAILSHRELARRYWIHRHTVAPGASAQPSKIEAHARNACG